MNMSPFFDDHCSVFLAEATEELTEATALTVDHLDEALERVFAHKSACHRRGIADRNVADGFDDHFGIFRALCDYLCSEHCHAIEESAER